jgi:apolipoprotein D and lipocalin family protein
MFRRQIAVAGVLVAASLGTAASAVAASAGPSQITPVSSVDLTQYKGKWFQIAALPAIYEAVCRKDDTANYTFAADGNISVANNCTTVFGGDYAVTGEARPDNAPADSELSVSFIDLFGLKFFTKVPNYNIVGLDPNYQWAVVVSPNNTGAFVLSRTPALDPSIEAQTQAILQANGYNPCTLKFTVQDGGATAALPYCSSN